MTTAQAAKKTKKPAQFGLALDIGYFNMKGRFGAIGSQPEEFIRPVGAAPAEYLASGMLGNSGGDELMVNLGDEQWVAATDPQMLQNWRRELHQDYPRTKQYQALLKAALLLTNTDVVDILTIGLPVDHYKNENYRNDLINRIEGKHHITPKRTVTVNQVLIIPQAAGAYFQMLAELDDKKDADKLEALQEGNTLVFDPGFFSVDWVVLSRGSIRYESSGSSTNAMSIVIDAVVRAIQSDYGQKPMVEQIENAVRNGKPHILLGGQRIQLDEYFAEAAKRATSTSLSEVKSSTRGEELKIDLLVPVCGGAKTYSQELTEHFPKTLITHLENPVMANARGFWHALETHVGQVR